MKKAKSNRKEWVTWNKKYSTLCGLRMQLRQQADLYEAAHDIETTWIPSDPAWIEAAKKYHQREYQNALDKVSHLLVRRLLELEKLGIGGTGL
jgi:hypothetical protein